jgi:uncharacterized protein (DUF1330 family)
MVIVSRTLKQRKFFMKTRTIAAVAVLAGVVLGVGGTQVLRAQSKPMAYVVAHNLVKDAEGFTKEFAPAMAKATQQAGGRYLARGGKVVAVNANGPEPRIVIIQFDNLEKAQAFADSPEAKAAWALGRKYGSFQDYIVEGVPQN